MKYEGFLMKYNFLGGSVCQLCVFQENSQTNKPTIQQSCRILQNINLCFFLFRSNANILLQHFCRPEVQLKTTDEIKN